MEKKLEEWLRQHKEQMEQVFFETNRLEELINETIEQFNGESTVTETSKIGKEIINSFSTNRQKSQEQATIGIIYSANKENIRIMLEQVITSTPELRDETYIFFTIDDIEVEQNWVEGFYLSNEKVHKTTAKIPPFIYNLALFSKQSSVTTIRRLRTKAATIVINPVNWFYQDVLLDMISSLPKANSFLLPYTSLNQSRFLQTLRLHKQIFLLKRRDYFHPEIITATLNEDKVTLLLGLEEIMIPSKEAYYTLQKMVRSNKYTIYCALPLLEKNGLPVECRVYVQKGRNGSWQVTSKVTKHELFASRSIFHFESEKFEKAIGLLEVENHSNLLIKLNEISSNLATFLDFHIPNVGSYYFDFVIAEDGNPYLLYIGGVEQFDYLERCAPEDWSAYLKNILYYLQYVSKSEKGKGFGEGDEDVD